MRRSFTLGMTVALAACSSFSVNQDFAPGTDYSPYQSFGWMPGLRAPQGDNQFLDQRIKDAITSGLEAKGYGGPSEQPTFFVGYQLILDEQVDYQTVNDYWGAGWGYGGVYGGSVTSRTSEIRYTVGTLVIDFFDARTRDLVWRGSAEGRVNEINDPVERQRRVDTVVHAILDQFPPEA